ncbi:10479_t:CDS:1 [Diversispora eburnea]|uniref:10479_t:CDS:1 n=1 Tax=Diversispora eburnea TaxID=1213867 RepID=A0A9N8VPW5_9GLOM|nr:10479_t:CDS:1 [Diversispora eburnea]
MSKMVVYSLIKQSSMRFNQLRNLKTARRFFDPKNDVAFKKIFGVESNKPLLLSLLNLTLRRKDDDMIEDVNLLPQEKIPQFKKSILDVVCCDKKGRRYIVEIQNKRLSSFIQRLEYCASRTYSEQLFQGADYLELKPVILLTIVNHNIFPNSVQYISYHTNREEEEINKCFLPNISYIFIELPKFDKCREQLKTSEDYWIHLLKEASNETKPPKEVPDEIQKAYDILEQYNWTEVERISYEKTRMAILDDEDAIRTAVGEAVSEIAKKLLKEGVSHEIISKVSDLSTSRVGQK